MVLQFFNNQYVQAGALFRSLVKCGMRKVKCGIEKCVNGCGMVGKMREN